MRARPRPSVVVVAAVAAICLGRPASAQRAEEYQVKAAFLQSFARFVEWPAPLLASEFRICILGDDPFGHWIDDATAGARAKDRPVVVRRVRQVAEVTGCQTVFISASEASRVRELLERLDRVPVLTVSDLPRFAEQGGMLGFAVVSGRVRFVANPAAALAAGLQLTSELLRVADRVVGRAPIR